MSPGSRKSGALCFCAGCLVTCTLLVTLTHLSGDRPALMSAHPVYQLASQIQRENLDTSYHVTKTTNHTLDNIKHANIQRTMFNFGEFMRGEVKDDERFEDIDISHEEAEHMKAHNLCPKSYQLDDSFWKQYENLDHVSSLTIAENRSRGFHGSTVNASRVADLLASQPHIVILVPLSNEAKAGHLEHTLALLCALSYAHARVSIVMGEDSSTDDSLALAEAHAHTLTRYFRRVTALHFDEAMGRKSHFGKHDEFYQLHRRGHMARARNQLLSRGLTDEQYVLWLDADLAYVPRDLIQHLLAADRDVIVPSCMTQHPQSPLMIYDRNSWRETPRSLAFLERQSEDFLKLEGYTESMRNLLPDIKDEGHLVTLDGVGGCALMVKADCHRKGLIFPPFVFQHHIETEGLAKMAIAMGYGVYGYPFTYVIHV